jgi:hypothetical protein
MYWRYEVFGALVGANASQSAPPPSPPVNVTVTWPPGTTVVVFTISTGATVTENVSGFEVPPPGDGENTETCALPTAARSAAEIAACNCVALTKVVGRFAPFHRTTDDETNPVPFTLSVSELVPASTELGVNELRTGTAFGPGATVTAGLVAARVYPLFKNKRNS